MTSLSHLYNDFSALAPQRHDAPQPAVTADAEAELRLAAYEEGYKAGWEDAAAAKDDEGKRLTGEFVQTIQDLSFTYHEALAKLSAATAPLLSDFVLKLLPEMLPGALRAQLAAQLTELVAAQADGSIELTVAPDQIARIKDLLEDRLAMPFGISADPSLSPHQVYLRVGTTEREINLDAVMEGITAAVDAYLDAAIPETADG